MIPDILQKIVPKELIPCWNQEEGILEISDRGESAEFYNQQFEFEDGVNRPDSHNIEPKSTKSLSEAPALLVENLPKDAIVIELGGSIYQRRSGNLYQHFKNYMPLDISRSSIVKYRQKYNRVGIVANAEKLPFKDESVDAIFTHTFLEHPHRPDLVVKEICRVLKKGGMIIHKDAWFVRWWQRYGVVGIKAKGERNFKERLIAFAAAITEIPILRFPPILLGRAWRHLWSGNADDLRFKRRRPNYSLMLACDEDAASSIDPVDLIMFYESNGFISEPPLSLKERVLFRKEFVLLRKRLSDKD
jgi:SAM-dependent methyltransferase